jgi:hypothetical protein
VYSRVQAQTVEPQKYGRRADALNVIEQRRKVGEVGLDISVHIAIDVFEFIGDGVDDGLDAFSGLSMSLRQPVTLRDQHDYQLATTRD